MPVRGRNQSAQALQVHGRLFLIDCGEGVQYSMVEHRIPMMKLDSLFISHIHGDHVFGFFGLLSTLGMKGRQTPLNIFAPPAFGPMLKFFLSYYGDGVGFEIRFTPLKMKEPETILETKSIRVQAFPLNHGIETFGFRFEEKEPAFNVHKEAIGKYGLTLTEIGTLKRGEDVVRADGSVIPAYLQELQDQGALRHHSTTLQAAALAREAGVQKLLIGHYSSRCAETAAYQAECRTLFPETYATSDGDSFDI